MRIGGGVEGGGSGGGGGGEEVVVVVEEEVVWWWCGGGDGVGDADGRSLLRACSQKTSAVHSRTHATSMAACMSSASESSRSTRMPMERAASCVRCADAVQKDAVLAIWRTQGVHV